MKYDAFGFLPKIFFPFFSKKFIQVFSSSSKFPDLELDMFIRFWALGFTHIVAPSSDHWTFLPEPKRYMPSRLCLMITDRSFLELDLFSSFTLRSEIETTTVEYLFFSWKLFALTLGVTVENFQDIRFRRCAVTASRDVNSASPRLTSNQRYSRSTLFESVFCHGGIRERSFEISAPRNFDSTTHRGRICPFDCNFISCGSN